MSALALALESVLRAVPNVRGGVDIRSISGVQHSRPEASCEVSAQADGEAARSDGLGGLWCACVSTRLRVRVHAACVLRGCVCARA